MLKRILTVAVAVSSVSIGQVRAQETAPASPPVLTLELNALQPSERGCRFTFVVENRLGGGLDSAAFEMAIFDRDGRISRLTLVDFKDLPDGKTKVRQFDFPSIDCAKIGRVLVNDATECRGLGIDPAACMGGLVTASRVDAVFGI